MKKYFLVFVIGFLLVSLTPGAVSAQSISGADPSLRKIVVFEKGVPGSLQSFLVRRHGATIIKPLKLINAQAMLLPARLPEKAKAALLKEKGVIRIDDDILLRISPKPENPGSQGKEKKEKPLPPQILVWGADRIDSEIANAAGHSGAGVKVAVIDTGIDPGHPDLNVAGGINTINPRKGYNDDNGHGSHCAGIIAALNNAIGVVGVAPGASLYAVKALNRQGSGYLSDIIQGIDWSIDNGVQVISMSFSANIYVPSFYEAVAAAYANNITLVAAAGNNYGGPVSYPAAFPEVIAVSATDQSDNLANFSNRGPQIELSAPGVSIFSTYQDSGYEVLSGTSMSCPYVAGTAALIISSGRASSNYAIRNILADTADDLGIPGRDNSFGYGLVDAEQAATGIQTNP